MSDTVLLAVGAIIGIVIREGMLGIQRLLDTWQKNQEARRVAIARETEKQRTTKESEAALLLDRQEKQIVRKDAQIEALQRVLDEMKEAHADCRAEVAELQMCLKVWRVEMLKAGMNPCELPLPRERADVDFDAKTVEQTAKNLAAIDVRLNPEGHHADSGSGG